ncbi:hypothetical protein NLU13_9134 [Sarocladium strictum]|uniref:Uncharacterized protein n=1 Tax=Sarocladium strictum TaxID=5046 RepID=A0AA39L3L3_SARSR|nr:hypothetical protein NLU13_9134 [Sarocladium strictum]
MLTPSSRILASRLAGARSFHASARRMADAVPLPAKRPLGAFRGGLFGFLFGSVLSGGAVYSYLVQEYKTSNDLLTEDIYTLRQSVNSLTNYVQALEQKSKK